MNLDKVHYNYMSNKIIDTMGKVDISNEDLNTIIKTVYAFEDLAYQAQDKSINMDDIYDRIGKLEKIEYVNKLEDTDQYGKLIKNENDKYTIQIEADTIREGNKTEVLMFNINKILSENSFLKEYSELYDAANNLYTMKEMEFLELNPNVERFHRFQDEESAKIFYTSEKIGRHFMEEDGLQRIEFKAKGSQFANSITAMEGFELLYKEDLRKAMFAGGELSNDVNFDFKKFNDNLELARTSNDCYLIDCHQQIANGFVNKLDNENYKISEYLQDTGKLRDINFLLSTNNPAGAQYTDEYSSIYKNYTKGQEALKLYAEMHPDKFTIQDLSNETRSFDCRNFLLAIETLKDVAAENKYNFTYDDVKNMEYESLLYKKGDPYEFEARYEVVEVKCGGKYFASLVDEFNNGVSARAAREVAEKSFEGDNFFGKFKVRAAEKDYNEHLSSLPRLDLDSSVMYDFSKVTIEHLKDQRVLSEDEAKFFLFAVSASRESINYEEQIKYAISVANLQDKDYERIINNLSVNSNDEVYQKFVNVLIEEHPDEFKKAFDNIRNIPDFETYFNITPQDNVIFMKTLIENYQIKDELKNADIVFNILKQENGLDAIMKLYEDNRVVIEYKSDPSSEIFYKEQNNLDLNLADENGNHIIQHIMAVENNEKALKQMISMNESNLEVDINVNTANKEAYSPLMVTCLDNKQTVDDIKMLCDNFNANVNYLTFGNYSALNTLMEAKDVPNELLIDKINELNKHSLNWNLEAEDPFSGLSRTPVQVAYGMGIEGKEPNYELVKMCIENGADLNHSSEKYPSINEIVQSGIDPELNKIIDELKVDNKIDNSINVENVNVNDKGDGFEVD